MVPWSVIKVVPDVLRFSAPLSLKAWKRGVHQQQMGVEYYWEDMELSVISQEHPGKY
jgi:hypothetical protein